MCPECEDELWIILDDEDLLVPCYCNPDELLPRSVSTMLFLTEPMFNTTIH